MEYRRGCSIGHRTKGNGIIEKRCSKGHSKKWNEYRRWVSRGHIKKGNEI